MSLGTDLKAFAVELAAALEVPVEIDTRDLVLPGILLSPGPINFNRLGGSLAQLELDVYLIAGDSNTTTALDELTHLLMKLRKHLGSDPVEVEPITVNLPSQAATAPLPAFLTQLTLELNLGEETP